MKDFITKIVGSLDNITDSAFSARKLSALVVIILVIILHIKWFAAAKWEYIGEILFLDYTFILVCLGLTTWQTIQTKKIDKQNESNSAAV